MEEWQQKHINQNLPELISKTQFNIDVKAKLLASNILSKTDIELLDAESDRRGKSTVSYHYYSTIVTRTGAYAVLLKILEENKQTGASNILKNGLVNFGIPKIFQDVDIEVQGANFKLNEFFPVQKLEKVKEIFHREISEGKFIPEYFTRQEPFVLSTSTIPPEPPFYIPRFLSNRIEISESIFKVESFDIFVFRSTIERWKLSEIVKPNWTDSSNSQLNHLTARFIHLDEYEDWTELKKKAKVGIHLISYDAIKETYILEDSSGASEILKRIGSQKQRVYLSEDEFVKQQLSEDLKASSVCICNKPGMGKTYLLANIARLMTKHCHGTVLAFIQLSKFVADFNLSSKDPNKKEEIAILNVFKYFSSSWNHAELLVKLVKAKLLRVEIFFDGFDEIPSKKVGWMKEIFLGIKNVLPNVRVYITSRSHMRHELEKSLGVIAYNILPFNVENQVEYLVRFWSPNHPQFDQKSLENYALNYVEEINKNLSQNEKEAAGIPLLCQLIAEIDCKKVDFYVTTKRKNLDFPLKIGAMYQQFIQQRIEAISNNEDEFRQLKLVHIFHALQLLFPKDGFQNDDIFSKVNQLKSSSAQALKAGILHLEESPTNFAFIHRKFAEYFVAEYFSKKLKSTEADVSKKLLFSILSQLLSTTEDEYKFVNYVIVNFVDYNLQEIKTSETMNRMVASFCASISPVDLLSVLGACCHHNVYSLFSFLKEALRKWDLNRKNEYFTTDICFALLLVCVVESTSQMFHSCIQLFTGVLGLDMKKIVHYDNESTLLSRAAYYANYEAFEYLIDKVPTLKSSGVLKQCVCHSYNDNLDKITRRTNILQLLLNKRPNLINENPNILATTDGIHVNLFKTLVKLGANLTGVNRYRNNCLLAIIDYMSPVHFEEIVNFLLINGKAEHLFLPNEKWRYPLPVIIRRVELSPEMLNHLFNLPGIDFNKKDEYGEKLLFNAVGRNKMGNLEYLVNLGLDYNERGYQNASLLHLAASYVNEKMVQFLISLNLDPNSCDDNERTPVHCATSNYCLGVSLAEILVENGADVQAKNNKGRTALHTAASHEYGESCDVMKYLIRNGARVNDGDDDGNTPLHLCKREDVRDCLIEMGADIHVTNNNGETPAQKNPDLWELYIKENEKSDETDSE